MRFKELYRLHVTYLAWVVGVGVADRGLCGVLDLATSISGAEHRLVNATWEEDLL